MMSPVTGAEIIEKHESAYSKRTPRSSAAFQSAREYFPGGSDRSGTFYRPYPIWVDKAENCRLTDVDGNEYIDFHNCFTVTVLGHAHPQIVRAIQDQAARGLVYGAATPSILRWADLICRRVRSIEKIRFANSGTEAVMFAIRAARAFTGKDLILKMQDGFIGTYDPAVNPSDAPGLPKSVLNDSITIPFNDNEAAEKAITQNRDRLAAVVLEPMMGRTGQIPPKDGYLSFLREVTAANHVLLIFDEIQCFRVDYGGVQNVYGIKPDITALGKVIGGGLPVGALGGRADIMDQLAPGAKVYHSGTFTANPIVAAAGVAALEQLTAGQIARINGLGEALATGMRQVISRLNIKAQVTGLGSLQNLHFNTAPVTDGRTAVEGRTKYGDLRHLVFLALMERGVLSNEGGLFSISTPMTEKEIDTAVQAVGDVLVALRPFIEQLHPELTG